MTNDPKPLRSLLSLLTTEQRQKLYDLEQAVYDAGVDGGMTTSDAIAALYDEEKRLGVHDPRNTQTPRWPAP